MEIKKKLEFLKSKLIKEWIIPMGITFIVSFVVTIFFYIPYLHKQNVISIKNMEYAILQEKFRVLEEVCSKKVLKSRDKYEEGIICCM